MKKSFSTIFLVIITATISLCHNVLSNWLGNYVQPYIVWVFLALLIAGIAFLIIKWRQKIEVDIDVYPLRDTQAQEEYARKGIIIFLSLYRVLAGEAKKLTPEQIRTAAKNLDYKTLDLGNTANTTLGHQIKAIQNHISKLEHCWIVCSRATGVGKNQSIDYAPVFIKYLKNELSSQLNTYYYEYSITLDDDAIVCRNTYNLIKKIYNEAKAKGLNKDEIILDITGGFRAMTVGAILACLDKDNDIQYIGAAYNEDGNPTGDAFPMIVQYKPESIEK